MSDNPWAAVTQSQIAAADAAVSGAERDAISGHIYPCWNLDAGAMQGTNYRVRLALDVTREGRVTRATVHPEDEARMAREPRYRSFVETARRAAFNPRCSTVPVPRAPYEHWRTLFLTFDPRDVR
ncbi:MAG: hypothetical protein SF002_18915 [Alphaproteobacteria bacterium]|nr:hypothetical protein [Alphaproteobacteria bacterium]